MKATTRLVQYLSAWEKGDIEAMKRLTQKTFMKNNPNFYEGTEPIQSFDGIIEINNIDGIVSDCICHIEGVRFQLRLIREKAFMKTDIKSPFGVVPNSIKVVK